ncbi:MAG: ABC transporter ATP-binding protein [Clostridia bacterium]|nr:ABC transporter ATP-binding protein [Clostridia bacterium]
MTAAIEVKNVSKKFKLYHNRALTLKDLLVSWHRQKYDIFWALKDISFTLPQGVSMGLIGSNGSGKSTLLKLIGRILYPDSGGINVHGRVSTLLELGAGFHYDFTGRENIYFNASILGFSSKEIKSKIDEIISFAEVGDFIDMPVRNYSTGMFARLGFAVAIHVDPDIILIDEVLAVGDLSFKQKCLKKIREFKKREKTIIIVSHSLKDIEDYCDVALWLDCGEMKMFGSAREVSSAYKSSLDLENSK